jgi:hypothetical protein
MLNDGEIKRIVESYGMPFCQAFDEWLASPSRLPHRNCDVPSNSRHTAGFRDRAYPPWSPGILQISVRPQPAVAALLFPPHAKDD